MHRIFATRQTWCCGNITDKHHARRMAHLGVRVSNDIAPQSMAPRKARDDVGAFYRGAPCAAQHRHIACIALWRKLCQDIMVISMAGAYSITAHIIAAGHQHFDDTHKHRGRRLRCVLRAHQESGGAQKRAGK